jgi:hypothetical protein
MASASLDDVPHRRRNASYPEVRRTDPKNDVFLNQDTSFVTVVTFCPIRTRIPARRHYMHFCSYSMGRRWSEFVTGTP